MPIILIFSPSNHMLETVFHQYSIDKILLKVNRKQCSNSAISGENLDKSKSSHVVETVQIVFAQFSTRTIRKREYKEYIIHTTIQTHLIRVSIGKICFVVVCVFCCCCCLRSPLLLGFFYTN